MRNELILVLVTEILTYAPIVGFTWVPGFRQWGVFLPLCDELSQFPLTEAIRAIRLILLLVFSGVLPLSQKRIYHVLLPVGRQQEFSSTMRDFLIEPAYMQVFSAYLAVLDTQEGTERHTATLLLWKSVFSLHWKLARNLTSAQSGYT